MKTTLLKKLKPSRILSIVTATITAISAVAIGLGTNALLVNAADEQSAIASASSKPALTVTTTKAMAEPLAIKLAANGNVTAWQETIVGAEVNGLRLTDVRVNVGDVVQRGQVLATFAPETVAAELAQQKASVAEAEAALAEAQSNADRARTLEASGALSTQQINQYTTAAKTAEARLAAARAVAVNANIRLGNTRVLAPDSGVIAARNATVGSVVQAGQELFRMIRNNRLEWRAEVSAVDLNKVKAGQKVALTTPAGSVVSGKVRMIAPTIDAQTRNTLVYVDLPNGSDARAGMFAKGEFELGQSNALTVPTQAVVVRDGFSYVFVLDDNNKGNDKTNNKTNNKTNDKTNDKANNKGNGNDKVSNQTSRVAQIKVSVGRRVGDRLEVTQGLKTEQLIVANGAGFLNDGDLVAITIAPPSMPSAQVKTKEKNNKTPVSAGVSEQKMPKTPVQ